MGTTTGTAVNWTGEVTADTPGADGSSISLTITFPLSIDKIKPHEPLAVTMTIIGEASSVSSPGAGRS